MICHSAFFNITGPDLHSYHQDQQGKSCQNTTRWLKLVQVMD